MRWDRGPWSSGKYHGILSKYLFQGRGRRIDLHRLMKPDGLDQFHSHPARSFRIILWGGYIEQMETGQYKVWKPGMMGYIPKDLCHRIHLVFDPCYTLWFRGKDRFKVRLVGYDGSD